jgi:hypothetical protein
MIEIDVTADFLAASPAAGEPGHWFAVNPPALGQIAM